MNTLSKIMESIDIVSFIQQHVELKRRGKNYVGLCPFHSENNPSFTVNPEAQLFYCFGCGRGGNIFNFVMEYYGCSFSEAVNMLKEQTGIGEEKADELSQFLEKIQCLFEKTLIRTGQALDYLRQRGITEEDARRYRIGFAPKDLFEILERRGLLDLAKRAGITKSIEGRITFAFFDSQSNPVGFAARSIDDSKPKYINVSNSPLFRKEHFLFGLNFLREKKDVYVVEGYFDTITCLKSDIPAVATGGTYLSIPQINQLKRFNRIIVAFDGDKAGVRAALRALKTSIRANVPLLAVFLPKNEDPDSFIRKKGKDAFLNLEQKDLFKFFIEKLMSFPPHIAIKKLSSFKSFLKKTKNEYSLILLKQLKTLNTSLHVNCQDHREISVEKQILHALFSNKDYLKRALDEGLLETFDSELKETAYIFLEKNTLPSDSIYAPVLARAMIKPAPEAAALRAIKYLKTKKLNFSLFAEKQKGGGHGVQHLQNKNRSKIKACDSC